MAIKTLQAKLTPLGRIRLGQFEATGKGRPKKLETFRFTSPSQKDIQKIAELYGGDARPWTHRTLKQPQFEVVTATKVVPVYVPPQTIDPYMELWGNGFCARRCDGETELLSAKPCLCEAEDNRQCKPTTRMSVILAELEGFGGWGVESHGWNAAGELAMVAGALANAPAPVPADLVIDWRQEKKLVGGELKTFQYAVPVLRFAWFTPKQAFAGQLEAAGWAAVGAAARPAIESGPSLGSPLGSALLQAANRAQMLAIKEECFAAGWGAEWTAKARVIAAAEEAEAEARVEAPVDAEVVDEDAVKAETDAMWQQIVAAAGSKGWNTAVLTSTASRWLSERFGSDQWTATPDQFRAFAAAIEAGEVQP